MPHTILYDTETCYKAPSLETMFLYFILLHYGDFYVGCCIKGLVLNMEKEQTQKNI